MYPILNELSILKNLCVHIITVLILITTDKEMKKRTQESKYSSSVTLVAELAYHFSQVKDVSTKTVQKGLL